MANTPREGRVAGPGGAGRGERNRSHRVFHGYASYFFPGPGVLENVQPVLLNQSTLPDLGDTDFGVDIDVLDDLPPNFTLVRGPRNLLQALARRYVTEEGVLRDNTGDEEGGDYGYDLRAMLNTAISTGDVAAISSLIEAQAAQDPRVKDVVVEVDFDLAASDLTAQIHVETDEGPFDLVLKVTELTVTILSGQAAA